ncbi:MAG: aminoacetone oxidase family FAD-binding enzyme, partial [bacterium]
MGWTDDGELRLAAPAGEVHHRADATVLALGGASWARLGSDGAWVPALQACGVVVNPLQPANCGFDIQGGWSDYLRQRFAGQPVKPVAASLVQDDGTVLRQQGEFVLTEHGIEGSLIYALSADLRGQIEREGRAELWLVLFPVRSLELLR